MTTNSGTAILGRLIEADHDNLPPEVAEYILRLDFEQRDHKRMRQLSAKASAGALGENEKEELDEYLRIADLLAFLQSKARKSLKRHEDPSDDAEGS